MRRMVWVKRDGRWHGEWTWEAYERDEEWDIGLCLEVNINRRWREMGDVRPPEPALKLSSNIPQEVLICMLKEFYWMRSAISLAAELSRSTFQDWGDRSVLAAASGTCRAWLAICAPELYRCICVRSSRRVDELIEDLSKPGSHIPQHARVHGHSPRTGPVAGASEVGQAAAEPPQAEDAR